MQRILLSIGAVFLRPEQPFTWASGIKSPIYCDNRLTLTAPEVRKHVEAGLAEIVRTKYPQAEVLMGTSTAGIAHAAITADDSRPADGLRPLGVEGPRPAATRLKAAGEGPEGGRHRGSDLDGRIVHRGVNALRESGAEVLGVASIFTYGMKKGLDRLREAMSSTTASRISTRWSRWPLRRDTSSPRTRSVC